MRELKFRVWDNLNNRMFNVWKLDFILKRASIGYDETSEFLIEDYHTLQYTGLKDKNGVEIYEGDILKLLDGSTYEVKFYVEDNELDCSGYMFSSFGVEIIGNIYENPELLEQ